MRERVRRGRHGGDPRLPGRGTPSGPRHRFRVAAPHPAAAPTAADAWSGASRFGPRVHPVPAATGDDPQPGDVVHSASGTAARRSSGASP